MSLASSKVRLRSASGRSAGTPRRSASPDGALAERWVTVDGIEVYHRESAAPVNGPVMTHLHGFGLSGRYLLPTAEALAGDFHTLVPDLPGFGRSGNPATPLGIVGLAHAAAAFLDAKGIARATLVGNSMGCPVIVEFARRYPERIDRAVLVSPAGGVRNQPLPRAALQLAQDGLREPTRMLRVAVPDYLRFGVPSTVRLFRALTRFPSLDRLLALRVPTLVVLGDRDPLMPTPQRVRTIATRVENPTVIVVIEGAAHAINFSHPGELSHVIRLFMADQPVVDDPDSPGFARAYEVHRGVGVPVVGPADPGSA